MIQYISIIRKSDFTDLFKYGYFYVHHALTFDGLLCDQKNKNNRWLFDMLTYRMNNFEYSFEYVLIHFEKEKFEGDSFFVHINELHGVYALNEEAKKEMSISFDPRIPIHVSPWAKWFDELQQNKFVAQCLRGVDTIWKIFELSDDDKQKCEEIISRDVIEEVVRQLFAHERPKGDLPLWVYLLRYERHSFYPKKKKIGFFYDLIHVVCSWIKKEEAQADAAESTNVYKKLKGDKFEDLFKSLEKSEEGKVLAGMTKEETSCDFYRVAPLFLLFKSKFGEGLISDQDSANFIEHGKTYKFEFSIVAYILGITLGYDKTYDAYYDKINLPLFNKKRIENNDILEESESEVSSVFGEKEPEKTDAASGDDSSGNEGKQLDNSSNESVEKEPERTDAAPRDDSSGNEGKQLDNSSNESVEKEPERTDAASGDDSSGNEGKQLDNSSNESVEKEPIAIMHKGTRGKKNYETVKVFSKEEIDRYRKQGYAKKQK
ncbi:MAG: hypothetical protein ACRDD6_11360 [Tannerellaceae bacterium]